MVTAKTVVEQALTLLGHVDAAGAVNESRESRYYGAAPAYLTVLQLELARAEGAGNAPGETAQENLPGAVTSLDEPIQLQDETALKTLPAGLAMYFALIDRDTELYNHFSRVYYGSFVPSARPDETSIIDHYHALDDPYFH